MGQSTCHRSGYRGASMSHLGTPINRTYQSKVGTTNPQGLLAELLVRVTKPVYQVRCITCQTVTNISHERFDGAQCSNTYLHGRGEINRSQTTQTISPSTATRSRDAASAREYQRQGTPQSVRYSFRGEPNFAGADPSNIAAYLDYQENH